MACRRCSSSPAGLPWSWRGGDGREGLAQVAAEAAVDGPALLGARAGPLPPPLGRPGVGVRWPRWAVQGEQRFSSCRRGLGLALPLV